MQLIHFNVYYLPKRDEYYLLYTFIYVYTKCRCKRLSRNRGEKFRRTTSTRHQKKKVRAKLTGIITLQILLGKRIG